MQSSDLMDQNVAKNLVISVTHSLERANRAAKERSRQREADKVGKALLTATVKSQIEKIGDIYNTLGLEPATNQTSPPRRQTSLFKRGGIEQKLENLGQKHTLKRQL